MPFTQTTLAQLRQDLRDAWEGLPFWAPADELDALNEAIRYWNLLTGQWKSRTLVTTTANQWFYSVSGLLTFQFRLTFNGRPLDIGSVPGLDLGRPNWRLETTTTGGGVPTRPVLYAPVGLTAFAIWPADAAGGNSLEVDAVKRAPVLAAEGDFIDIGPEEETPILDEALHILTFNLGGEHWKRTLQKHRDFLLAAADRNARLRAETLFRMALGLDAGRKINPLRYGVPPEVVALFSGGQQAQAGG